MKLSSKFGFLGIFVAVFLTGLSVFVFYMSATSPKAGLLIPFLFVPVVIYFWLTEFRTRAHKVIIEEKSITVKEYFGLGKSKRFQYNDFKGFITSKQPGKFGEVEYIFIIKEDKRQICISAYYHRNYAELKEKIKIKLPYLGEKEYKFGYEFKQMFR